MKLVINGQEHNIPGGYKVSEMVGEYLKLDPRTIAVERNLEIVPRSTYDSTSLNDGDKIEIVHFVGGG